MSVRNMLIGSAGARKPDPPTGVSGTAQSTTNILVSFSAPANNGGSTITSYTVTASPGGATATTNSSPVSVGGLTASTSYTFTVTATNAIGTSDASSPSASVTTQSNYIGTVTFANARQYNTSQADWTVPNGTNYIWFKMWGSGGSNAGYDNGLPDGDGGGGGFTTGIITTTSGETLRVAVGTFGNNGGTNQTFGNSAGGFSGVFRSGSPLLMAGGGGHGQTNGTQFGGAGGGSSGQGVNGGSGGGTQTAGGGGDAGVFQGASDGGGGGYYGGSGGWPTGGGGGSGYIGAGVSQGSTTTGNARVPAGTGDSEYPGVYTAYGGIGFNAAPYRNQAGSGYVIAHCYAVNPAGFSVPSPRITLASL